jgi:peptide chain release factor 2
MPADFPAELAALDSTLAGVESVVDVPGMRKELAELEQQASDPSLWDDQANAQKVTSRLSFVQGEINKVTSLRSRLNDLHVLVELAQAEEDESTLAEA